MEKFEYCILDEDRIVKYRGKIISYINDEIVFTDYKTSKVITLDPKKYGVCECTEEYYTSFITIIERAESDPVFSEADYIEVFGSETPHSKYHEISGIRYLGFKTETSMDNISIRDLRPALYKTTENMLKLKIGYVDTDDSLDDVEKASIRTSLIKAHAEYLEFVSKSHSKRDILFSWPPILAEDLPFYIYIIALCDE